MGNKFLLIPHLPERRTFIVWYFNYRIVLRLLSFFVYIAKEIAQANMMAAIIIPKTVIWVAHKK